MPYYVLGYSAKPGEPFEHSMVLVSTSPDPAPNIKCPVYRFRLNDPVFIGESTPAQWVKANFSEVHPRIELEELSEIPEFLKNGQYIRLLKEE